MELWQGESDKIIRQCAHCGTEILKTQSLCDECRTKDKREVMHKINIEIFKGIGVDYQCKVCTKLLAKQENRTVV